MDGSGNAGSERTKFQQWTYEFLLSPEPIDAKFSKFIFYKKLANINPILIKINKKYIF